MCCRENSEWSVRFMGQHERRKTKQNNQLLRSSCSLCCTCQTPPPLSYKHTQVTSWKMKQRVQTYHRGSPPATVIWISLVASTVFRPRVRARRGRCYWPQRGNTGEEDARGVIATALKGSLPDTLAWEGTRLRQQPAPEGRRKARGERRQETRDPIQARGPR
jgi:hypothetical protein